MVKIIHAIGDTYPFQFFHQNKKILYVSFRHLNHKIWSPPAYYADKQTTQQSTAEKELLEMTERYDGDINIFWFLIPHVERTNWRTDGWEILLLLQTRGAFNSIRSGNATPREWRSNKSKRMRFFMTPFSRKTHYRKNSRPRIKIFSWYYVFAIIISLLSLSDLGTVQTIFGRYVRHVASLGT